LTDVGDGFHVRRVDPRRLHDLRRRVLRGDDPAASVIEPRDDEATSLHLAGLVGEEVVVCASFFLAPYTEEPASRAYQLRFMATDPAFQGRGYGARVLDEAEGQLRDPGVALLWAYARDPALGFYLSAGWIVVAGSEFLSAETALPHTVIVKSLSGAPERSEIAPAPN
jgi:GNAT superfamily N-acetyltransferase